MFKPGDLVIIEHTRLFKSHGHLSKELHFALISWESSFLDTYICARVLPDFTMMHNKLHVLGIRRDGQKSEIGRDSFMFDNDVVIPFVVNKNFIDISYYI